MSPSEQVGGMIPTGLPRRCGDVPCVLLTTPGTGSVAPQVRGCPRRIPGHELGLGGCPAGAGMSLTLTGVTPSDDGLPRRCGDVPLVCLTDKGFVPVAPQVRGCPVGDGRPLGAAPGCPAGAGMSRSTRARRSPRRRLPRRCGDVPLAEDVVQHLVPVAPQVRGCPQIVASFDKGPDGCPAGAGMSPWRGFWVVSPFRLPRRCGDVPGAKVLDTQTGEVAPQVRGCPDISLEECQDALGCPAGAGMSLAATACGGPPLRLPRRCGDVPGTTMAVGFTSPVAPQVRGCPGPAPGETRAGPGCPAGAGMSPAAPGWPRSVTRLPRRCGDVPTLPALRRRSRRVAPAGAGMSLGVRRLRRIGDRLPRRCGDVPDALNVCNSRSRVAPQVRGCPVREWSLEDGEVGCPAGAGMSR